MSPFNALRAALVPAAIAVLGSACESAPIIPGELGGSDEVTPKGKKTAPAKKVEPTDQPAPKGDTPPPSTPQPDQPPTLSAVSPAAITIGQSPNGVELTLEGTRFPVGSVVDIAGAMLPATVISSAQIKVQVPADKVKLVGSLRIAVVAKPGLVSNPLTFTVANPMTVTIATLAPASVVLGEKSGDVALTLTGTGYAPQSVVRFNGAALATTFTSATALSATIPAVAFIATGRFSVTVATGTDVVSLPTAFQVRNPSPAATAVTPATVAVGDGATVLTVVGNRFTKASEVFIGSAPLATTFVTPTQLRATVPSYLIAKEGALSLFVTTGAPGGGTSIAVKLTVKVGQSATPQGAQCAYKCADYGYKPYTCYSNWYCIGGGANTGCLAQTPCTDTAIDTGNPNEKTTTACDYKCKDYSYAPGECAEGWYCRVSDGCLVKDSTCAASTSGSTTSKTNACKYACGDYGYVKGECDQGYYCQYADGCLVQDSACGGSSSSTGSGGDVGATTACTYPCSDYNYAPGDCRGGYYCQFSDKCLVADATCH